MKSKENGVENKHYREVILKAALDGIILDITSNCFRVLGYTQEEMIGHNIKEFLDEEMDFNLLCQKADKESVEIALKDKSYNLIYLDVMVDTLFNEKDEIDNLCLAMIDITKYKDMEKNAKRLRRIFDRSEDIIYSLEKEPKLRFYYLSPSIHKNLGYTLEEGMSNPMLPLDIVHPDDYDYHLRKFKGEVDYSKHHYSRLKHKNGKYIWFEEHITPIYDDEGKLIALEGITRNIQDRKELEEELERLSYYDSLTGIHNKRYFQNELNRLNDDIDVKLGIIICDLDNLKHVNDTFGHAEGDIMLKQAALLLSKALNEDALIARIGGDEFALLLKNLDEEEFKSIYDKINEAILECNSNRFRVPIQISIGAAYSESSIGMVRELFKTADKNMYLIKKNKKKYKNEEL